MVRLSPQFRDYDAVENIADALARITPQKGFEFTYALADSRQGELVRRIVLGVWSEYEPGAAGAYVLRKYPPGQQGHPLICSRSNGRNGIRMQP